MATRVEQLIDALVTTLEGDAAITPGTVHRNRAAAFSDDELPGYNILIGQDVPLDDLGASNVAFIDWAQIIYIDCYEKSIAAQIDNLFLDMRRNVHRSLMADATQGLGFVWTTIPQGAEQPVIDNSGEQKSMVYRLNWEFRLRTSISDLEM